MIIKCLKAGAAHQRIILKGKDTPDYATVSKFVLIFSHTKRLLQVQGIFIGVVAAFTLFMILVGPE